VFDHVTIRVGDRSAGEAFYRLALGEPTHDTERYIEWREFGIASASLEKPVTRRLHVGFGAHDRAEVDSWWERLTGAGYRSDGEPGERPQYTESYYGAFVLDPDGNSVELVHHHTTSPEASVIDHLWLRTASVQDAKRFYETIAPAVGIRLVHDAPDRVRFTDGVGSFSFVEGDEATENVHYAFGVGGRAAVDEFHRLATAIPPGLLRRVRARPRRPERRGRLPRPLALSAGRRAGRGSSPRRRDRWRRSRARGCAAG
jgi:catechol 2,3-dioxygenase-like lactoylglutathione lyase family enzyme